MLICMTTNSAGTVDGVEYFCKHFYCLPTTLLYFLFVVDTMWRAVEVKYKTRCVLLNSTQNYLFHLKESLHEIHFDRLGL